MSLDSGYGNVSYHRQNLKLEGETRPKFQAGYTSLRKLASSELNTSARSK